MPVPIPAVIPIAISMEMIWIALFDQVQATKEIERDWLPEATFVCGVKRDSTDSLPAGGRQV
jgi:hypothetical protein